MKHKPMFNSLLLLALAPAAFAKTPGTSTE